jgi:hypothetical protein
MRWISEERAWGCDRCKRLYPVPRDYPSGGPGGGMGSGGGGGGRVPWLLLLGALVVIGAGVATGLALTGSDGDEEIASVPTKEKDTSAGPTVPKTVQAPPLTCEVVMAHATRISRAKLTKEGYDEPTMKKMEAAGVTRCREDAWSEAVLKCIDETTQQPKLAACRAKLGEEKEGKLARALEAAAGPKPGSAGSGSATTIAAAAGSGAKPAAGSGSGSGSKPAAGSGSAGSAAPVTPVAKSEPKLPKECVDYTEALLALSKCRRLPAPSRDALKQAHEVTSKEWEGLGVLDDTTRKELAARCKKDMGSIKKSRAICAASSEPDPGNEAF